ncbi:MAG: hypothetical protein ACE15B_09505 [Bryobacteraceae bacterium]
MKRLIPMLFCLWPLLGQGPGQGLLFPAALRDHLGLTAAQVQSLNRVNLEYNRFVVEKQFRMAQVQREINEETQRQQLDAMALGLRYVEQESIRRELRDRLEKTRRDAVAVLNDAQRAKLKILEDAMKLRQLIEQAQCENLLVPPEGQPIFAGVIRAGDFTSGMPISGIGCGIGGLIRDPMPNQP